jgi:fatty acid desaturase
MDKMKCYGEKMSKRAVGLALVPLAVVLAALGFLILPVLGVFFSAPLFVFSLALMFAPDSAACRLVMEADA